MPFLSWPARAKGWHSRKIAPGSAHGRVLALVSSAGGMGHSDDRASSQAATPPAPAPKTDDERPKVVVLGDSLTAGLGLLESQSYPSLLQQKIDGVGFQYEVVNAGVSGDTSAGGLRRLDWSLQEDVRVLIVALGANDGLRGLSVAEMKQNLTQIIERRERGTSSSSSREWKRRRTTVRSTRRRSVRPTVTSPSQYHVPFVPFLLDKVAGQAALNQADGIHPNPEGAAIVADTVWNVLKPLLDQISVHD